MNEASVTTRRTPTGGPRGDAAVGVPCHAGLRQNRMISGGKVRTVRIRSVAAVCCPASRTQLPP